MEINEVIKNKLAVLPNKAGVYHFLGKSKEVLYVGKAKNLKARVKSYFRNSGSKGGVSQISKRIEILLGLTDDIEWIITVNENEALVLENSHIKNFKPKFNILFRDDKTYPYLRFSKETFSRLSYNRIAHHKLTKIQSPALLLGPYPDSGAVREAVAMIQKIFRLRTCSDNVFNNRRRACLLHQIKRCSAPCVGLISPQQYQQSVDLAIKLVSGKQPEVFAQLENKMQESAQKQHYEKAAEYRDQLNALRVTASRQRIVGEISDNCDLISCVIKDNFYALSHRAIRKGQPTTEYHNAGFNPYFAKDYEIISEFIRYKYLNLIDKKNNNFDAADIPIKIWINSPTEKINCDNQEILNLLATPKRSREKEWMARLVNQTTMVLENEINSRSQADFSLQSLGELLNLNKIPEKIECVDVSHLGGKDTTASWVVFINGKAARNLYRRYHLRNITAGDDYGAIAQLISRRYDKLNPKENENSENILDDEEIKNLIPDLLIIDGGKGQLKKALEVVEQIDHPELSELTIIGLAKGRERIEGNERIVHLNDDGEFCEKTSSINNRGFALLLTIRDEAHRFAITGQKALRKKQNYSRLEDIGGIGAARRKNLISRFGSLSAVKTASREQLMQVAGISEAMANKIIEELS